METSSILRDIYATSACCSVKLLTVMYAMHTLAACERSAQSALALTAHLPGTPMWLDNGCS